MASRHVDPYPNTAYTHTAYTTTTMNDGTGVGIGVRRQQQTYSITPASFWFDPAYIYTIPGILKCVQLVLDFIAFICVLVGPQMNHGGAGWATFVTMIGFCITLSLLIMYIFHAIEATNMVPWTLVEMIYCFVWSVFYFIAACVLAILAATYGSAGAWGVASFFAFLAMFAYAADCALKFREWRAGNPAQGSVPMPQMA